MGGKVTPGKQLHPLVADFKLNFIDENRWEFLVDGLGVTLLITLFATILGVIIGVIVAGVCSTWDKNGDRMRKGPAKWLLQVGNKLCRIFLTVIRGTPVVIQLMLFYFVILVSVGDWNLGFLGTVKSGVIVAIIAFGINSGAYVAEIIRGGIMSIDQGQFEAGRSLGFNYIQTMWHIIIPQALKNVLPSLANEFIVLLKETSVAGYVAVTDLTKAGDIIKGVTYSPFLPLIAVAIIYLVLVMFFTWLVGKLERRLRNSER
ncbi:MAG: amino acid ABC transporter permease [Clostridiales bacterium]|nr:amino acid ABC transporter permease [Clostridiales bacterium]